MTRQEFDKKWGGISTDIMTDEELYQFKQDCFEVYEAGGFSEKFHSPYDDTELHHNGKPFTVLRRATEEECDLEAMPLWVIMFEGEDVLYYCYPEEICEIN